MKPYNLICICKFMLLIVIQPSTKNNKNAVKSDVKTGRI